LSKRLRRRTQQERLGESKKFTRRDWKRIFPEQIKKIEILNRARSRIESKISEESQSQILGSTREKIVVLALQSLKEKGEIAGYLSMNRLSYSDLIEGVDFLFVYIDGVYETCRFSVTGKKWIKSHQKKHPEIPVISINLDNDNLELIEQKILALKKNGKSHFHT